MRKTSLIFIPLFALFLILPLVAKAYSVKTGDAVYISKDEVISGNLYAAGANVTIDGKVEGDVFAAGQTVNINGLISGDVFAAGQAINVNGEVGGSVRAAGNTVNLNAKIARGVQALGASVSLGQNAEVGWDVFLAGANAQINGKIARDLYGSAATLSVSGEIGRDVRVKIDQGKRSPESSNPFQITAQAKINGELVYTAASAAAIDDGAQIRREIKHTLPKAKPAKKHPSAGFFWGGLYSVFAALVIGLVLTSLWREKIVKITDLMLAKMSPAIGWGAVLMFLTPILCLLLVFTLIGLPLALIIMAFWLIALYISKVLVGILVGRSVLEKFWSKKKDSLIYAMIIGIVLVWLIASLPFIGWIISLVALWWGLGGLWLFFKKPA